MKQFEFCAECIEHLKEAFRRGELSELSHVLVIDDVLARSICGPCTERAARHLIEEETEKVLEEMVAKGEYTKTTEPDGKVMYSRA